MTSDPDEVEPTLPLHKEFGIFCVGWIGAICATFLLALAGFDVGERTLREFLYECLKASIAFLAAGMFGFVGLMIIAPYLARAFEELDWGGRLFLSIGVIGAMFVLVALAAG